LGADPGRKHEKINVIAVPKFACLPAAVQNRFRCGLAQFKLR